MGVLEVDRVRCNVGVTTAGGCGRTRHGRMCPTRRAVVIGADRGRVGRVWCRCAVGFGGRPVVSDALRHCDLRGAGRVGVVVPRGFVGRVWCRRVLGIGRGRLVSVVCSVAVLWGFVRGVWLWACLVSLRRGDRWGARRVGCAGRRCVVSCHVVSRFVVGKIVSRWFVFSCPV